MQLWKPSLLILPAMLELALRLLRGLFLPFFMELLFFLANPRELFFAQLSSGIESLAYICLV